MVSKIHLFAVFLFAILLFGCTNKEKKSTLIPDDNPTIEAIPQNISNQSNKNMSNDSNSTDADKLLDDFNKYFDKNYKKNTTKSDNTSEDNFDITDFEMDKINVSANISLSKSAGSFKSSVCKIDLEKNAIKKGEQIKVDVYSHARNNERVTFLCDDVERFFVNGGLTYETRICSYSKPGLNLIWVALDGQICASAPLRVYSEKSNDKPMCKVLSTTLNKKITDNHYVYSADVYFENFNSDKSISVKCMDKSYSINISDLVFGKKVNAVVSVKCNFSEDPEPLTQIPVNIGAYYCGDISS